MKIKKKNKALFDKKRFEWMEKERREWLQSLSIEKSIKILESLTTSEMLNEFREGIKFFSDKPVCLKFCLKRQKNGITTKNI